MKQWFLHFAGGNIEVLSFLNKHNLLPDQVKIVSYVEGTTYSEFMVFYYSEKELK